MFEKIRAHRRTCIRLGNPFPIVLCDESGKETVGFLFLHFEEFAHLSVGLFQFYLPEYDPAVQFFPFFEGELTTHLRAKLDELLPVVRVRGFADDTVLLQVFFEQQEELIRIHRFDEVVRYLSPDGLCHDMLLFAFRYHDDGCVGFQLFDLLQSIQSADAGHVLIEEYDVEVVILHGFYGIVATKYGCYLIPFLFEK